MTVITLTTDFGLRDGYVGVMKGVILSLASDAQLVDICHDVAPHDVRMAIHLLAGVIPYFPVGAIHLAVVDPGVGGARRPILVTTPTAAFVGPDNGILTPALAVAAMQAWELDRPQYWLPEVSATFHGRDIFAPVVGHLARGIRPEALASPITDPARVELPAPQRSPDGSIRGEIVYADRFGNLITNIPGAWLAGSSAWRCYVGRRSQPVIGPLRTYNDAPVGAPLALVGGSGAMEIAVREGSAQTTLQLGPGAPVLLQPA